MDEFIIRKIEPRNDTINRTIRIKWDMYDKLIELSESAGVSFNKIINQRLNMRLVIWLNNYAGAQSKPRPFSRPPYTIHPIRHCERSVAIQTLFAAFIAPIQFTLSMSC
jgi:hypothetical protein